MAAASAIDVATPASLALAAEQARPLFKALADPLRLELVQALAGGERCVCELTQQLGLAQSRLSFHLRVMREAELIEAREQGRWVYYRLRPEALEALQLWLAGLAGSCRQPAPPCS
jgi:ArsR family transcriptional regulator, arsenate/arsenite/antimonite-responsive transcriptional repressor